MRTRPGTSGIAHHPEQHRPPRTRGNRTLSDREQPGRAGVALVPYPIGSSDRRTHDPSPDNMATTIPNLHFVRSSKCPSLGGDISGLFPWKVQPRREKFNYLHDKAIFALDAE